MLDHSMKMGIIKGLKVSSWSAPPITKSMFADDLLLMGNLGHREVLEFDQVFTTFCQISGMKVSESKS